MILDESFGSVSDSDDVAFLDEFGVITFEEGFRGGSFVSENAVDHRHLGSFVVLDGPGLS